MNEEERKKIADLVKRSLRPMNRELARDLWPQVLQRLEASRPGRQWYAVLLSPAALSSVPWFDWALLAVLIIGICVFPKTIPIWLYHF
jgi:hypothetical protein